MTREPFIAHSELTNEIYIVSGREKYRVTEQAIKAVDAIKALEQQTSEDCISRAKALDTLKTSFLGMSFERYKKAKRMFEQLPPVTPQRPKGKWVDESSISYICSCCSYRVGRWNNMNYCPNCGAKMEVEE